LRLPPLPYPHWPAFNSPMAALLQCELRMSLRDGRNFLRVAVLLGVMTIAGVAFALFISEANVDDPDFGRRFGSVAFEAYAQLLFFCAALLIPVAAATAICLDRQRGELDALLLTRITPGGYLAAKALRILCRFGILIVATFPFTGLMFFFSSLEVPSFLSVLFVLTLAAASSVMAGLFCSSVFRRTVHALLATAALLFMLHFGIGLCVFHALEPIFSDPADAWYPILCDVMVLPIIIAVGGDLAFTPGIYLSALAYHALTFTLFAVLARRNILRPMSPTPRLDDHPIDNSEVLNARRRTFPYYLLDPRRRRPLIGDRQNPIYVRELQADLTGHVRLRVFIAMVFGVGAALMSVWYVLYGGEGPRGYLPRMTPTMIQGIFLISVIPIFVAPAMAREFESDSISTLRTTLLGPREIALGKLRAALTALTPLAAGLLLGTLPLFAAGYPPVAADLGALAAAIPYTIAIVAAATWTARKTITSLMWGYGAALGALVGIPYVSTFFIEYFVPTYFTLPIDDPGAASFLSPLLARIYIHDTARFGFEVAGARAYLAWNQIGFALLTLPLLLIAYGRFRWRYDRS